MTRFQQLKKSYRHGVCFQSSMVPSLYEAAGKTPGYRQLALTNPAAFEAGRKRLTTFDMGGRMAGKTIAAIIEAIRSGAMTLSNAVDDNDPRARKEVAKIVGGG